MTKVHHLDIAGRRYTHTEPAVTQLDTYESVLLLVGLAKGELRGKADLRAQLASVRLTAVEDALHGKVDMPAFEAKILGVQG